MARANDAGREYLLDVAETILARDGLRGLTIRALTQAAGMNIASVNYGFGSKDALLIGLQERMFRPMTRERLDRFAKLQRDGHTDVPSLVRALIEPLSRMRDRHPVAAVELYRYMTAHPDPAVRAASWNLLEPGLRRFEDLMVETLPQQPKAALMERIHLVCQFAVPAVLRALDVFDLSASASDPPEAGNDLDVLVQFLAGGLDSPDAASRPAAETSPRRTRR